MSCLNIIILSVVLLQWTSAVDASNTAISDATGVKSLGSDDASSRALWGVVIANAVVTLLLGIGLGITVCQLQTLKSSGALQKLLEQDKVYEYKGFTEHAYRYVFYFGTMKKSCLNDGNTQPGLLTILPTGAVENLKDLQAEKEKGLIAYVYPQTLDPKANVDSITKKIEELEVKNKKAADTKTNTDTPLKKSNGKIEHFFVAETRQLTQTWPTSFNAKFMKEFALTDITKTMNDEKAFETFGNKLDRKAAIDYAVTIKKMFKQDPTTELNTKELSEGAKKELSDRAKGVLNQEDPVDDNIMQEFEGKIFAAHKKTENESRTFVGYADALIKLIENKKDTVKTDLKIESTTGKDMFTAKYIDGKGQTGTKNFAMDPNTLYVLYQKKGWETMACVKPKDQFDNEAKFWAQKKIHYP